MLTGLLLLSLALVDAQFPSCHCDQFINQLIQSDVGSHACAKYENSVVSCMAPQRPFIWHQDSGCPTGMLRCIVAENRNPVDFKFTLLKNDYVKHVNAAQPDFKPCTCTEGVNGLLASGTE